MTFLHPVNLALLGLVVLIVAAYLLRMPRRRLRVPDATVARLALSDVSRINRQKRTLISLAIQVVILALLVLAAAMPYLGDARDGTRSLIVLFDVSASMQADDSREFRVLSGDEKTAMAMISFLREEFGVFVSAVTFPVVPRGVILFRMIPTAAHTEEDVDRTVRAFREMRDRMKLDLSTRPSVLNR